MFNFGSTSKTPVIFRLSENQNVFQNKTHVKNVTSGKISSKVDKGGAERNNSANGKRLYSRWTTIIPLRFYLGSPPRLFQVENP